MRFFGIRPALLPRGRRSVSRLSVLLLSIFDSRKKNEAVFESRARLKLVDERCRIKFHCAFLQEKFLTDIRTLSDKSFCNSANYEENWGQLCGEHCELTEGKDVENYLQIILQLSAHFASQK